MEWWDGGNKFGFALSELIVDKGFEDLWRKKNPNFSEFTYYNRSSVTRSRIDWTYTDKKLLTIPKLIT